MAAPTFVGKGPTTTSSSPTSISIPLYSDVRAGDLIVVALAISHQNDRTPVTVPGAATIPGYSELPDVRHGVVSGICQCFYRIATGDDAAVATYSTVYPCIALAKAFVFRGVGLDPFDSVNVIKYAPLSSTLVRYDAPSSNEASGDDRLPFVLLLTNRTRKYTIFTSSYSLEDATQVKVYTPGFMTAMDLALVGTAVDTGEKAPSCQIELGSSTFPHGGVATTLLIQPTENDLPLSAQFFSAYSLDGTLGITGSGPTPLDASLYASYSLTGDIEVTYPSEDKPTSATLYSGYSLGANIVVATDERSRLKSRFLPGACLSQEDFSELIDFVVPVGSDSLADVVGDDGILYSSTTGPKFSTIPVSDFILSAMSGITSPEDLADKVVLTSALAKVSETPLYTGVGVSATNVYLTDSSVKISIGGLNAYTSVSATNALISIKGQVNAVYCTSQRGAIKDSTVYEYLDGYSATVSSEVFDVDYSNFYSDEAGEIFLQLGSGGEWVTSGYRVIRVSSASSYAGMTLSNSGGDNKSYRKSGKLRARKMSSTKWYLSNEGITLGYPSMAFGIVSCATTVDSIRITPENGELVAGEMTVVQPKLGEK